MGWELAVIAAALLGFSVVSRRLAGTAITSAMVFVGVGLVVGTQAFDLFDAPSTGEFVKVLAEATLAFVLFSDASRIDLRTLRREYTVPARLLGIGLPLTIVLGAILAGLIFGQISLTEAVVIGILLAPTDAALGQAVVTEPRLPSRIRQGLNVESGLNDGLCVPLLFIALAVAEADAGSIGDAHAVRLVVEQIGWGMCGGVIGGVVTAAAVVVGTRRGLIEPTWLQVVPAAGAGLAYGFAAPLGGSGFIAAFVAGMVFSALRRPDSGEVTYLIDQLGEVLNAVTLLVFGAVLLLPELEHLDWRIAIYAIASLTVVRMLPVAIAMLGTGARRPTIAFMGWFGPRGLASIVFALIVLHDAHLPHIQTILSATYVTVGLSVLAHGVSAAPLTGRYVSWFESHPADRRPAMESVPAAPHRLRRPAGIALTSPASPASSRYADGTPPARVTP
jgi:NhaP-type Na+/H+ or K+/H+ antiporter